MQPDQSSLNDNPTTGWPSGNPRSPNKSDAPADPAAFPSLNLPKGGGAIRGIGEKFAANPVTGTGSMSVPVCLSPGRSGFGPRLSLSYDSGSGNSPFGYGWSLSVPTITRKTDKGLPQYFDAGESDIFILSGAEDLMPGLVQTGGEWARDIVPSRTLYGQQYAIHRYRPRVEGLFARIERWINLSNPQDTFWRSISKDNITSWYGLTAASRIADPADPSRIFSWLISQSYDDKGNVVSYQYKQEDSSGVDLTQANERNRTRTAKQYIKYIYYGNRTPYLPDLTAEAPAALPTDWCFDLVFDYGEHDLLNPVPDDTGKPWTCRLDPFSTYRSTFEIRTYRLCRRVLMFHQFPDDPDVGTDCLVRSTDLVHASTLPADPSQPFYSYLLSVSHSSYLRNPEGGYFADSLPPVEFEYTEAIVDETVRDIDPVSLQNFPYGLDGKKYRWVDLDGEGVSGILTEQGGGWFYKANLSPANRQTVDGERLTIPQFAPVELVARQPSLAALDAGRQQLIDLTGDGRLDLAQFDSPAPGFFERTENANWEPFQTFESLPVLDWQNPNLKFIDLTGDGFSDLLISEDDVFWWHQSLGADGFAPAQRVPQSFNEEKGPQLVFADGTESIFLADMSGDGLTDLVRIRLGEVCYWPNLGYGRFGAKVTMDGSPRFDRVELFDCRNIRLADIDGSGTSDIIYLASGEVDLYFNQSGNGWGGKRALDHFPSVEKVSSATTIDLLGAGTACLVWSSPLGGNARQPMRYIDLMGGQKPHLLVKVTNNLGSDTRVDYAPSTRFYVADKIAGTPWVTRLPFPVHVVECVKTYDYISRSLFATRYTYHHGYYDGVEREFRGFGRVDQFDSQDFATLTNTSDFPQPTNINAAYNVPPAFTKTWFHTGAFFCEGRISRHLEHEYYSEGGAAEFDAMLLDDTILPATILLPDGTRVLHDFSGEEFREACRALRGSILRQEVYALDNSPESDRPYSVSERNYTLESFQPQGPNQYGVFFAHPRESIDFSYERQVYPVEAGSIVDSSPPPPGATTAADPRVKHALTLAADQFGNVLQSVSAGYGRRYLDPALSAADQTEQNTTLVTYTENTYTNYVIAGDVNRAPLPSQSSTYELLQVQPTGTIAGITNLFDLDDLLTTVQGLEDGLHDIPFENVNPTGLTPGQAYRRALGTSRTYYRPDDMGAAAGNPRALLALGALESLALPGASYKLAFTPGLISDVYQRGATALLPTPASVLGSVAADGGGYVDLDGDGSWWMPSNRLYYSPTAPSSPQEKNQAVTTFFLPRRFEGPFGDAEIVDYDSNALLMVQTTDAAGNVTAAVNDYRVLAPSLMTDPNGNQATVSFDVLGLVEATALMGKSGQNFGDLLTGFTVILTQSQIDDFYDAADPHTLAAPLIGNATTRVVYDVHRFYNSRNAAPADPSQWQPVFAATIAREIHYNDPGGPSSPVQISFSYSDGFGREIQKKIQSEPGPVIDGGPVVNPRWVGSGWTIFNNKGKPVRKYEPFFSQLPSGQQFEFDVETGVSSILCYDPLQRVVATIHPNQTYEKVVFDPWHKTTWDVNDTVLQADPTADPDVGDFFTLLPAADYSPTWYTQRIGGGLGAEEQDAATKAAAHGNTPMLTYFDTLGRTFLTIADNAAFGKYSTHVELDIQSNQRSVTDPVNRTVAEYDYDALGNRVHQASMEAGERWILNDVTTKLVRAWDGRGHNFRTAYDALRRTVGQYVLGTDPINSDQRTTAAEVLFERIVYGEGEPNDQALNLRTRIFQYFDGAGVVNHVVTDPVTQDQVAFDFKGNLLGSSRQFVEDYQALPDWSQPTPSFLADIYVALTQFDALNRTVAATTPDGSVVHPTYNEANLLQAMSVNLLGAAAATSFVANIDYNARGQRVVISYGNNTATTYSYDPLTFRLTQLTTSRAGFPANQQTVQDLAYTYDPVGNITHIQDDADIQNVVFFRNQRVEPSGDYTYDAIYRLIQASGREQLGLSNGSPNAPWPTSYNDVPRIRLISPSDGNAMGTYTEQYNYDDVGNFLQFIHRGSNLANPGWTRSYAYNEASLLEPAKFSNRLSSTTISGNQPLVEPYSYDLHGNMASMPQSQSMSWDFKEQLLVTQRQAVNASDQDGQLHQGERTYYVYNASGERVRKTTQSAIGVKSKERFYMGAFEDYLEYGSGGATTLERETLHVFDDKRRIALVETEIGSTSAIRYQFDNHLGTAYLELAPTGAVITYEEYYPFGSTSYQAGRSVAEVSLKRYRFTGKERDNETGLYYHGARYYAPWLGRWTACDPKGIDDGLTAYWYAHDNPVTLVDRRGTDTTTPEITPKEQARREQWRKEYTQKALIAAGEAIDARKQITRLQHLGGRDMFPYMKEPNLDKAEELRLSLIATYENIEHHAKVATVAYALAAQYGPPPEPPPPEPRFQFDVQDKDRKGLHLDVQVSGVHNESKKGEPAFASVDTQATLPLKDYALLKYNAIHSILEISTGHEPAISVTESVHIKDPSDTSKVTGHTQSGVQIDALDIDIKKGERDIVELKVTLAGSYDVKSGSGQGQVQVGAEAHVTPKSFSIVGQAQFPFDSSGTLPPSYGGGVLWHF
jgi:RHS repeat-associated protein